MVRPIAITDEVLVTSSLTEDDYAAYASGTTYAIGDRVIVIDTDRHEVYESLQNSNTGHDPTLAASSTWWLLVGPTNRWAMFDESITTQSVGDGVISVTLVPRARFDSVALFNLDAESVDITVSDPVDGAVYTQTHSLIDPAGVDDWWEYFFEPVRRVADQLIEELPLYPNATVSISLSGEGDVKCGALVLGLARDWGNTQYGAAVGITDYSTVEADDWGNYYVVQRAFAKRAEFMIEVPNTVIDTLQTQLAAYRATPVVYVGATEYGSTMLYGYYRDLQIEISYPSFSLCSLTVQGLT